MAKRVTNRPLKTAPAPVTPPWELPEYASVDDFVLFLVEDDRVRFALPEVHALRTAEIHRGNTLPALELVEVIRGRGRMLGLELEFAPPATTKHVRGWSSWDNNRWAGNECAGGSGYEQVNGFAGREG